MSTTAHGNSDGDDFVETRVIDRSDDIDQRPPEERDPQSVARTPVKALAARAPAPVPSRSVQHPAPPAPSSPKDDGALTALIARHQQAIDAKVVAAKGKLASPLAKVEAHEAGLVAPDIENDLQLIRFERQKILIGSGPMLQQVIEDERLRLADLEAFKADRKLTRQAHYPSSPVFAIGVLFLLLVIEAGLNGVLFAETSEEGLFGGWLEALVLSVMNLGAAFLLGRLVLPHLSARRFLARALAGLLAIAGIALIVFVNLLAGHYRDFKAELARIAAAEPARTPPPLPAIAPRPEKKMPPKAGAKSAAGGPPAPARQPDVIQPTPARGEFAALQAALEAPFAFQSFASMFLLVIGLAAAALAALDGYKLDDPLPGYGRRHRAYVKARQRRAAVLAKFVEQANAVLGSGFLKAKKKLDAYDDAVGRLCALHRAYDSEWQAQSEGLRLAAEKAEAEIALAARLSAKATPPAVDVLGVPALPLLPRPRAEALERHQKKCAALKKQLAKEQALLLELFEPASSDFQALLASASLLGLAPVGTGAGTPEGASP